MCLTSVLTFTVPRPVAGCCDLYGLPTSPVPHHSCFKHVINGSRSVADIILASASIGLNKATGRRYHVSAVSARNPCKYPPCFGSQLLDLLVNSKAPYVCLLSYDPRVYFRGIAYEASWRPRSQLNCSAWQVNAGVTCFPHFGVVLHSE